MTLAGRTSGRGCVMIFGLLFAGIGAVFGWFILSHVLGEFEGVTIPCEVESCEIEIDEDNRSPFRLNVSYRYDFNGTAYISNSEKSSDDYEALALQRTALLEEEDAHCFVNPDQPSEAVLERHSPWIGLILLMPLAFVAVGITFVIAAFRATRRGVTFQALSSPLTKSRKYQGGGCLIAFGAIFFIVGGTLFAVFFIVPLIKRLEAKDWVETDCTIIWSRVNSHSDGDGTTYSVDIFYEYEWNGAKQRSNRYGFSNFSSSGRGAKQAVVDRYPPGSRHRSYVNPERPEQAVLNPQQSAGAWAYFPLIFVLVGSGIVIAGVRSIRKGSRQSTASSPLRVSGRGALPTAGHTFAESAMERLLNPGRKRWAFVLGVLIFALFWNGLISFFVIDVVEEWAAGRGNLFLTLFLIPFVLVGIVVALVLVYALLGLFNPRAILTLPPGNLALGERVRIEWRLRGSAGRLRDLHILVLGREEATYVRGTTTTTDRSTFYRRELFTTQQLLEMHQGSLELEIPPDLMFTFNSGNNAIVWVIQVKGSIAYWPDVNDEYRIDVHPGRMSVVS